MTLLATQTTRTRLRDKQVLEAAVAGWDRAAPCKDIDPDDFFNEENYSDLAKNCGQCPVVSMCLSNMLGPNTPHSAHLFGLWGGVNADRVEGRMLNYVRAISGGAVNSHAGDEAAYIATRFLMDCAAGSQRGMGKGSFSDELFEKFKQKLTDAGIRRLTRAVREILDEPGHQPSTHPASLVSFVNEILDSSGGTARATIPL